MSDTIYAVYYQGVHQKSYLIITTDEAKAREVADSNQGFPMEKWEDGHVANSLHYDGYAAKEG